MYGISIYENSELALASYADLQEGSTNDDVNINALKDKGMTQTQAEEFAVRYPEIVTQFNSTESGFSATVFKDTPGNLTLAIRGTEIGVADLGTDAFILLNGAGYDQIVDMYNWWQRVSSPEEITVDQYQLTIYNPSLGGEPPEGSVLLYTLGSGTSFVYLESAPQVESFSLEEGNLYAELAADSDQMLDVTGHSLGAHLALAFNSLFPDVTNEVIGFNTPGFTNSSINHAFFEALGGEVPSSSNGSQVTNIFADQSGVGDAPWDAIAGLHYTNNPVGSEDHIVIEDQWLSTEPDPADARNHSQMVLTDSLAVYNLFYQLESNITYENIFHTSSNETHSTLENIVDTLSFLLGTSNTELLAGNNQRDALYIAIYDIQEELYVDPDAEIPVLKPEYQNLKIVDVNSLASSAELDTVDGYAYRYALVNLTTFAVIGAANIYTIHNQNGELNAENFSEEYLTDRALMLSSIIQQNVDDSKHPDEINGEAIRFHDVNSGEIFAGGNTNGQGGSNTLDSDDVKNIVFGDNGANALVSGYSQDDHLYGLGGDDVLTGRGGKDFLEGGSGNDTLYGGDSNGSDDNTRDMLYGGDGSDTYYVGDGDRIIDSDRTVASISYHGIAVGGTFIQVSEYLYKNEELGLDLLIIGKGAIIRESTETSIGFTIFNFQDAFGSFNNGDFGITLESGEDVVVDSVIYGSSFEDRIDGTDGNDEIHGLGDDDVIYGKGGGDTLYGDEGRDWIKGDNDNDILYGGIGGDFLQGGGGFRHP